MATELAGQSGANVTIEFGATDDLHLGNYGFKLKALRFVSSDHFNRISRQRQESHVFHAPHCRHFNCRNCTVVFHSREECLALSDN
jgi:hypothetical protein